MVNRKPTLEQIRAYIKISRNPYASLSIEMATEEDTRNAPLDARKHDYLRDLQDPYATHAIFGDQETVAVSLNNEQVQPARPRNYHRLSKKDFRSQCRRIFSQYVPPEERNTLRAHHRDFIVRNESKSAEVRFLLAAQLNKYDVAAGRNIRPHFNRENDALTIEKLQKIERDVEK